MAERLALSAKNERAGSKPVQTWVVVIINDKHANSIACLVNSNRSLS